MHDRHTDCELHGHAFELDESGLESCSGCGSPAEPARGHGKAPLQTQDIHVCWNPSDHAFGLDGMCLYCHKAETALTPTEIAEHRASKQSRQSD